MFHITPIEEDHVAGFHKALDTVAKEVPFLGIEQAPPLDQLQAQVAECIKSRHPFLVAMTNDEIIGWCSIAPFQQLHFRFTGQLFTGILNQWRGLGIGTALVRSTLSAAWAINLKRVELDVCASNEKAVQLYRKLGFVDEGVKRRAYCIDGEFDDILVMSILRESQDTLTPETAALLNTA